MMSTMTTRSSAESLCRKEWGDALTPATGQHHVCKMLVAHREDCVCMCGAVNTDPIVDIADLFERPTDAREPAPTDLMGD